MKYFLLSFLLIPIFSHAQELRLSSPIKFLALGDSYTVGEGVLPEESWPAQLTDSLMRLGIETADLEIIARTGWRTDDLLKELNRNTPDRDYDLVSLLIGVNNQFQGRPIETYEQDFETLLNLAIIYAQNDRNKVVVLSIPDYTFTPFGQSFGDVSDEIDAFNQVNREIAERFGVLYIEITDISRRGLEEPELVSSDLLHPSALQYSLWIPRIMEYVRLEMVLGIEEENNAAVAIWPNMTNRSIFISNPVKTDWKLLDISGRQIKNYTFEPGTHEIDLINRPNGLYLLKSELGVFRVIKE